MTLWSHHVTSRVTVRTCTKIELNLGALMAAKKTDNAKKRIADAQVKRFWVYRF